MPTLLYAAAATPNKVGGIESFCHKLAVELEPLGWNLVFCGTSEPPDDIARALARPNLTFDKLERQYGISIGQAAEFAKVILKYRPDVLMYHLGGTLRTYPLIAKALGTKRIIYQDGTSRTSTSPVNCSLGKRVLARLIAAPITQVVAATEYVRKAALEEGLVPGERISVIPNGIDVQRAKLHDAAIRLQWRNRLGIPPEAPVVMQVGWVVPAKGFDKLLNAAKEVVSQCPATIFVMVGTGDHLDEYRALGENLGIGSNVKWIGAVSSPFNDGVYAMADVYCQLSQWQEAFGYTLVEAMAYGLPIVATDVGGIPETVRNGENGFILDQTDVSGVAQRILDLLNNTDVRRHFGQRSREFTERRFDLEVTVKRYLEALPGAPHLPALADVGL